MMHSSIGLTLILNALSVGFNLNSINYNSILCKTLSELPINNAIKALQICWCQNSYVVMEFHVNNNIIMQCTIWITYKLYDITVIYLPRISIVMIFGNSYMTDKINIYVKVTKVMCNNSP